MENIALKIVRLVPRISGASLTIEGGSGSSSEPDLNFEIKAIVSPTVLALNSARMGQLSVIHLMHCGYRSLPHC